MTDVNQHNALISLQHALIPDPLLIDGRTVEDRLHFLGQFATLINFYDHTNTLHGNWAPFLLKDPVILLSTIAKTRFTKIHSLYSSTCETLERIVNHSNSSDKISNSFNQLFNQLTNVFRKIARWTHYMLQSDHIYSLKTYVLERVQQHFSYYLWAIVWLQEQIAASSVIPGIDPINKYTYTLFDNLTWRQITDTGLFKQLLQLQHSIENSTPLQLFRSLKIIGDELFQFFHEIIINAAKELNTSDVLKSKFPDTILVRAFVNLLQLHQNQLNGIAEKHLEFYYRDILKQTANPAFPDSVFLYTQPAKKTSAFELPAGTVLNGGIDADKNPVLFTTLEAVSLNPATIASAYTLTRIPGENSFSSLQLQQLPDVGSIQTDEDGAIQSWPTFGKKVFSAATQVSTGVAFASPMLLLREGPRTVRFTCTFFQAIDQEFLHGADLYLSTQTTWLPVTAAFSFDTAHPNQAILTITLDATQPAIEPFQKNPDGFTSPWPLFKMSFPTVMNMENPPELTTLKIDVTVANITNFQLYNDYGTLSPKAPFQLFGPTPLVGSNFIIGNNEMFSKPLTVFSVELDWDALPEQGFNNYYQAYNVFIYPLDPPKKRPFRKLWCWMRSVIPFVKSCPPLPIPIREEPFNNIAFTVDFQLLQQHSWKEFDMIKQESCGAQNNTITCVPYTSDPACSGQKTETHNLLFSTDGTTCALTSSSVFAYKANTIPVSNDPEIQTIPFKYTDDSSSGYLKLQLSGPEYGFGSTLYPNVVSDIALKNAEMISKATKKEKITPIAAAALPFAPKVKGITANYTASQTYELNFSQGNPLQFFSYSPFGTYLSYDTSLAASTYWTGISNPIAGIPTTPRGIPLYPAFNYDGALFLELENLVTPNELSLYFELAGTAATTTTTANIDFFMLSATGWEKLQLLSDGTNLFNCSGIVKLNIQGIPATDHITMPGNNNWIAIALNGDVVAAAPTILLQPNGFQAQRSGTSYLTAATAPQLAAGSITKTDAAVPQIAAIVQPFASFGGKAAETAMRMHQRISNRLKTKDRAVGSEDYFRLIQQEFSTVYYSRTVYNPATKVTQTYVVPVIGNRNDAHAFLPMITTCTAESIRQFITERSSAFSVIRVSNFDFQYVRITADVTLQRGYECQGMQKKVSQALSILLSPWIADDGMQLVIDQGISEVEVATCIRNLEGITAVGGVVFDTWTIDPVTGDRIKCAISGPIVIPASPSLLLVSAMSHVVNCTYAP